MSKTWIVLLLLAAGAVAGATPAPGDHYLCYKAGTSAGQAKFTPASRTLQDQLGSGAFDVKKITLVCNPATKNAEPPPTHPNAHQVGYQIKAAAGSAAFVKSDHVINDQFGLRRVTLLKPEGLLAPSTKVLGTGGAPPYSETGVDHFKCYKVKLAQGEAKFVPPPPQVTDEFGGPFTYDLKKITRLCNPVNKNNEDPTAPTHKGHLVCYQAKRQSGQTPFARQTVSTNNANFGAAVLDAKSVRELCVPAFKDPTCGDGIVDRPNEQCDGSDDTACPGKCQADCSCPPPVCGDGTIATPEQCDPPGSVTGCSAGQVCGCTCQCEAIAPCACGVPNPLQLKFTVGIGSGNCGALADAANTTLLQLACNALYVGGGRGTTPPSVSPDMGTSLFHVNACNGTHLCLTSTTSIETGSSKNCTSAGCFFGAPLAIPNGPISTCVVNVVAKDGAGAADCGAGTADLSLPLNSNVYLTGDFLDGSAPDRPAVAGLNPCPLCTGPSGSETCKGGPNNGLSCTPGTSALNEAYPTSQDCPPSSGYQIGTLPIGFALTTGTATFTAVPSGTTQQRVFCGFCRDADVSGGFEQGPAVKCLENGVTLASCSQPFESCEQANQGAFNRGAGQTITENGSPAGDLSDHGPHGATLATVFCIGPTFNFTIDSVADLPGPGATTLQGQAQLLP